MYKFADHDVEVLCPHCRATARIAGRMYEDVDDDRTPVLLHWHLECKHLISATKFDRVGLLFVTKVAGAA